MRLRKRLIARLKSDEIGASALGAVDDPVARPPRGAEAEALVLAGGFGRGGDIVVVTAGLQTNQAGTTNLIKAHLLSTNESHVGWRGQRHLPGGD